MHELRLDARAHTTSVHMHDLHCTSRACAQVSTLTQISLSAPDMFMIPVCNGDSFLLLHGSAVFIVL